MEFFFGVLCWSSLLLYVNCCKFLVLIKVYKIEIKMRICFIWCEVSSSKYVYGICKIDVELMSWMKL